MCYIKYLHALLMCRLWHLACKQFVKFVQTILRFIVKQILLYV